MFNLKGFVKLGNNYNNKYFKDIMQKGFDGCLGINFGLKFIITEEHNLKIELSYALPLLKESEFNKDFTFISFNQFAIAISLN